MISISFKSVGLNTKGSKAKSHRERFLSVEGQNVGVRKDAIYTTMYISHLTKIIFSFCFIW